MTHFLREHRSMYADITMARQLQVVSRRSQVPFGSQNKEPSFLNRRQSPYPFSSFLQEENDHAIPKHAQSFGEKKKKRTKQWGKLTTGFPGGGVVKNPPANAGDAGDMDLIPGSGRSPGGGNGNALQRSSLENPMEREAWRAAVHGVARCQTQLSD